MSPTETVAAIAIEMACGAAGHTLCDGGGPASGLPRSQPF